MTAVLVLCALLLGVAFLAGVQAVVRDWWDRVVVLPRSDWRAAELRGVAPGAVRHEPCWWWFVAVRYCPSRCREVPCPTVPERVLMRQVALVSRHCYLQQLASGETPEWMHSHQWRWTFVLGLWGGYVERRLAGWGRIRTDAAAQRLRSREAPYCYAMSSHVVHQLLYPSAGHTSLFLGLWRDDDLKAYYPSDTAVRWESHIVKHVERI